MHYFCPDKPKKSQTMILKKSLIILIVSLLACSSQALCQNTHGSQCCPAEGDTISSTLQFPPMPAKPSGTAWIVISKKNLTLSVYDRNADGDTLLMAQFPCCMGKNKGNKVKRGDMRTPESPAGKPFKITMIQNSSMWKHDFHDGRGNIKAYGHWFLRLETPGHKGIGIHGSTNNEKSVPGRASEGCIRLLDNDIITLKEHFAYVGMPVTIQAEDQAPFKWETRIRRQ